MILYGTLALCGLGAGFLVYRHDLYDREPTWLLAAAVGLGGAAMALGGFLESWSLRQFGITGRFGIAAAAAVTEEVLKVLAVAALAVLARRWFNDPLDGLIYGSLTGLGMALEESAFYLQHGPRRYEWLPAVEVVRISGHLVMGGIGSFGLGMAAVRRPRWPFAAAGGLLAALGLHLAWDALALAAAERPHLDTRHGLLGAGLMAFGLILYGVLTAIGSEWSHRLFAPERPSLLWGWPFKPQGRKI